MKNYVVVPGGNEPSVTIAGNYIGQLGDSEFIVVYRHEEHPNANVSKKTVVAGIFFKPQAVYEVE